MKPYSKERLTTLASPTEWAKRAAPSSWARRVSPASWARRDGDRQPRLTRRGWAVVGLVGVFVVLGWRYSPRQLNAVAAPAVVALLVAAVSVWRADCRVVEVNAPPPGVPGEERTLAVDIEGSGLVTLGFDLAEGIRPTDDTAVERTVTLPQRVEWKLSLTERGIYEPGPLALWIHDPLGLVEYRIEHDLAVELAVYPRQYDLSDPAAARGELHTRTDIVDQEFDRVREYTPGDPLRRVDWKTSARQGDLHVVEFAERGGQQAVIVGGVAARGTDDEMARTVRTLVESALDSGLDVGVTVPDGRLDPGSGPDHREEVLRLLARTGPSTQADGYTAVDEDLSGQEADIVVDAGDPLVRTHSREPTIRTAYGSRSLDELRPDPDRPGGSDTSEVGT